MINGPHCPRRANADCFFARGAANYFELPVRLPLIGGMAARSAPRSVTRPSWAGSEGVENLDELSWILGSAHRPLKPLKSQINDILKGILSFDPRCRRR